MAFTVEDGTGIVDANAYCDVAFADAYFTDRGNTAWTGLAPVKQAALIQATDYIELRFSHLFLGDVKTTVQGLSFPRISDSFAEMPVGLKRACCEYAVRALTTKLLPDPLIDPTGLGLERTRKKVGPIEKETRYQYQGAGTIRTIIRPYPAADALLKGLIRSNSGTVIRG